MGAMSVLRSRILTGNAMATSTRAAVGNLAATPHVMPLAVVTYQPSVTWYNEIWYQPPATGNWNAVPVKTLMERSMGAVIPVPAGRP